MTVFGGLRATYQRPICSNLFLIVQTHHPRSPETPFYKMLTYSYERYNYKPNYKALIRYMQNKDLAFTEYECIISYFIKCFSLRNINQTKILQGLETNPGWVLNICIRYTINLVKKRLISILVRC